MILILLLFMLAATVQVSNSAQNVEQKLLDHLFSDYNHQLRPVLDSASAVHVTIYPWINYILIEEPDEKLEYNQWLQTMWKDDYLVWNPSDFGNISRISVPTDRIWMPDVVPMLASNREEIVEREHQVAQLDFEGNVLIYKTEMISLNCKLDMKDFPFDIQSCPLPYTPIGFTNNQITLHTLRFSQQQMKDSVLLSPEWELISFTPVKEELASIKRGSASITVGDYLDKSTGGEGATGDSERIPFITYNLVFRRKALYYMYVFIVPGFLITLTCIIGLFSPFNTGGERQEKVNLGLTTLLALAIMLQMVADSVPKGAEGLPLLGSYMMELVTLSTVGTVISMIIMHIHKAALGWSSGPPSCLKFICCLKQNDSSEPEEVSPPSSSRSRERPDAMSTFNTVLSELQRIRKALDNDSDDSNASMWSQFFDRIDMLFLAIFVILLFLFSAQIIAISIESAS